MSANAYYRELRSEGLSARRTEVLQLFKIAKSITTRSGEEALRNPDEIPSGDELSVWPTKNATGIKQNVTLTYRDKTTGEIKQTWWSTVTEEGMTRAEAMAAATNAYAGNAESYGQELIGAVHTSAYRLVPLGL
jgi:hypothetical protein